MAETLLAAHGITRTFGGLVAVNNVSVTLERGGVHAVIGTNGAGKSTLINILSGAMLVMIILGGLGHLRGALIGAFAFALLQELFKSESIFGSFAKHWQLGLGLTIIASVALLPRGLVGLPGLWKQRLAGRDSARRSAAEASS